MSILFQSNRNYRKFCACSGCTLYLTHMRRRTAPFKLSVSQVLCTIWRFLLSYSWLVTRVKFSSRRWGQDSPAKAPTTILSLRQSLQDLSVERAIDVIDYMGAVSTYQSSCCDAGFFVDKHFTLFNPAIQRCPSDSSDFCPRGKDLDLDGNASLKFWVSISFKSQAGIFLGFANLEKNTYGSILMIGHRRFTVVNRLWTLFMPSSRSQHATSATSEMLGSITYCSATWVRISNTHLWRFWRCWSRYKCSTGSFVWARGVVSALFESCCWSEYIGIWFDGFR